MIILKPDKKIKKRFGDQIDFECLSLVYSNLFDSIYKRKKKRNFVISLKLTAGEFSYYTFQKGSYVRINLSELVFDEPTFHTTLLHEFRHFIQDKVFRIPLSKKYYDDSTTFKYMQSPVEIDACNFESNLLNKVLRFYKKSIKYKLEFAELSKYKGKEI